MRNKESFSTGLLNKKVKEQHCANATKMLNEVKQLFPNAEIKDIE